MKRLVDLNASVARSQRNTVEAYREVILVLVKKFLGCSLLIQLELQRGDCGRLVDEMNHKSLYRTESD